MALVDKLTDAIALLEGLKADAQALETPVKDQPAGEAPALEVPGVDPEALKVLQEKVDALSKDNQALRQAIAAEIEDEKADTARLEAALAPIAEPAPVPVVDVETVASVEKAEEKVTTPDEPAKLI